MLTLERIKSLVAKECDRQQLRYGDCDECPIYNLFGRSGNCAYRLYDGQFHPEVMQVLETLISHM